MACALCGKFPQVAVEWMDCPAEVAAGKPFAVRLVVFPPCKWKRFEPSPVADQSAVTFAPYFQGVDDNIACAAYLRTFPGGMDTVVNVPGLAAASPRTFEIRATIAVNARAMAAAVSFPVRTFGEVTATVFDGLIHPQRGRLCLSYHRYARLFAPAPNGELSARGGPRAGESYGHGRHRKRVRARVYPRHRHAAVWRNASLLFGESQLGQATAQLELTLRRDAARLVAVDHSFVFCKAVLLLQPLHPPRERPGRLA